jgi:succinate-semialdehyde dehydrogenase/glutarate-semialdehyde dehydrogenase
MIISLNPATDETLARFEPHGGAEIEQRLQGAADAQARWARTPVAERMAVLEVAREAELKIHKAHATNRLTKAHNRRL